MHHYAPCCEVGNPRPQREKAPERVDVFYVVLGINLGPRLRREAQRVRPAAHGATAQAAPARMWTLKKESPPRWREHHRGRQKASPRACVVRISRPRLEAWSVLQVIRAASSPPRNRSRVLILVVIDQQNTLFQEVFIVGRAADFRPNGEHITMMGSKCSE